LINTIPVADAKAYLEWNLHWDTILYANLPVLYKEAHWYGIGSGTSVPYPRRLTVIKKVKKYFFFNNKFCVRPDGTEEIELRQQNLELLTETADQKKVIGLFS
jgi:hypothetical protein